MKSRTAVAPVPKKSRVSIQMDLLNTLQKKTRELTFNKTGNVPAIADESNLLIFAVNEGKQRADSKRTIKEQSSSSEESSQSGSDLEEVKT